MNELYGQMAVLSSGIWNSLVNCGGIIIGRFHRVHLRYMESHVFCNVRASVRGGVFSGGRRGGRIFGLGLLIGV